MTEPVSLSDLVVVGYADALPTTMRPVRLPPVFRWRDNPDGFLLPPFHLNAGVVYNGTEVHGAEAARLEEDERITLLGGDGWFAQPEHELWMDVEGEVRYQPRRQVDEALRRIYDHHFDLAETAFRDRRWDEAERLCGICILADEGKLEPYFMKAAILQSLGRPRGVERLREITGRSIDAQRFDDCVKFWVKKMDPVARPMYRVASYHPCCA